MVFLCVSCTILTGRNSCTILTGRNVILHWRYSTPDKIIFMTSVKYKYVTWPTLWVRTCFLERRCKVFTDIFCALIEYYIVCFYSYLKYISVRMMRHFVIWIFRGLYQIFLENVTHIITKCRCVLLNMQS
jgi:hypothetical protein